MNILKKITTIITVLLVTCISHSQVNENVNSNQFTNFINYAKFSESNVKTCDGVLLTSSSLYIDEEVAQPEILKAAFTTSKGSYYIISHGRSGELYIKGQWLQKEQIAQFISQRLTTNSQQLKTINIYGCEFAKGEKGKQAVAYLQKQLGLSIAASTNITGKNGDWVLETGNQEPIANGQELEDYNYNLQITVASDDFSSNNNSGGSGWLGNWTTTGEASFTGGRLFMDGGTPFGRATRAVNLTDYISATLNILGRCEDSSSGFESGDFVSVEVSTNGGASFTTLWTRNGDQICPNDDDEEDQTISVALPVGNANTIIRLRSDASSSSEDYFWDDLEIIGISNIDTDDDGIPDNVDIDDDNDGILDVDEGFTSTQSSIAFATVTTTSTTNATFSYTQATPNLVGTFTSSGNAFNIGGGSGNINEHNGNKTFDWQFTNGALFDFAMSISSILWDGSGRNRVGNFRLTLDDGTIIDNPTGTVSTTLTGFPNIEGDLGTSTINGDLYYGDINQNANQGDGYIVFSTAIQNQITAGGGIVRIQFNQNTTRAFGAGFGLSFAGSFAVTTILDTDNDGIINSLDLDSDNDGIPDNIEAFTTQNYVVPSYVVGNNGLHNNYDATGGDNALNATSIVTLPNTDGIGDPDYLDLDSDGDGIFDIVESGLANNDSDNDGDTDGAVGTNGLDNDTAVESIDDYTDVNGLAHDNTNFLLADVDNDTDADGNNASPTTTDLDYRDDSFDLDTDNDGINDNVDIDDDNDGILDVDEGITTTTFFFTETFGTGGALETNLNPNVLSGDSYEGISTSMPGTWSQTDQGGNVDGAGNTNGRYLALDNNTQTLVYQRTGITVPTGSLLSFSARVANLEGVGAEPDASLVIRDASNNILSSVALNLPNSSVDQWQTISLNFTSPTTTITLQIENLETNTSGNVIGLDELQISSIAGQSLDTDMDGIINSLDLDSDNDGIPDNIEAFTTQGYVVPSYVVGNNGLHNNYDATGGDNDLNATSIVTLPNTDSSNDAIPDWLDLDSDNDGIFDIVESGLANNDSDNDGDTDGTVGTNGLDNDAAIESVDDYTDVNGLAHDNTNFLLADADNDTNTDGTNAAPLGIDLDFRDNSNDECDASISSNLDTDGDGVTDICDIDDDNDGILDVDEGLAVAPFVIDFNTSNENWEYDDPQNGGLGFDNGDGSVTHSPTGIVDGCTYQIGGTAPPTVIPPSPTGSNFILGSDQFGGVTFFQNTSDLNQDVSASLDQNLTFYWINGSFNNSGFQITNTMNISLRGGGTVINSTIDVSGLAFNGWQLLTVPLTDANWSGSLSDLQNVLGDLDRIRIEPEHVSGTASNCVSNEYFAIDDIIFSTPSSSLNSDNDTIPDYLDLDSDNDGIPDNIEAQTTQGYKPPNTDDAVTYLANNGLNSAYIAANNGGTNGLTPVNTDTTDTVDYLDLDSDNDGIFDIAESGLANNDSDNDGDTDGAVGTNGLDNDAAIESADNYTDVNGLAHDNTNFLLADTDNDTDADGSNAIPLKFDLDYRDYASDVIISQIYENSGTNAIELTNIGSEVIPAGTVNIIYYANTNGDQTGITPTSVYTVAASIAVNSSILIESTSFSGATIINSPTREVNAGITNFEGGNDIVALSLSTDNTAWANSYEVIEGFTNITSYVRNDNVLINNPVFTASEWTAFVDDNLDPYRVIGLGGPERHPHDPLLSEVNTSIADKNQGLGYHRTGTTVRSGTAWSNGLPDRSRSVSVDEDYNHTGSTFSARGLTVNNNSKLAITDNALIVTDNITLSSTDDEIRLVGNSQLVSTHTNGSLVTGAGKLYVDQNSEVPSTYRYNYFSSPVNSIGTSTYTVADVFKDGSTPLSSNSTAVNINFTGGFNGATTMPISIAEYWIYTFGATANWTQELSGGTIPQTDGVIFKGPGQAQNYTFVGTPKDGTMQTTVAADTDYLVGNPYASAMSVQRFLEDNLTSTTGAVYFWEQKESINGDIDQNSHNYDGYVGGYAIRNIAMGLAANNPLNTTNDNLGIAGLGSGPYREPGAYIPIGQGFFVEGSATGGIVEFNNSQREYVLEGTNSVFFRNGGNNTSYTENNETTESTNTSSLPIIKLGMDYVNQDNLDLHQQIGISFLQTNSFAFDVGYDATLADGVITGFHWDFENDDEKYAIAGVQEISTDLEVPLTIKMGYTGSIRIRIDEWANVNRNVYLIDKLNNIDYLISDVPADIFLNAGSYTDRYVLAFRINGTLTTEEFTASEFYVYTEDATQDIMIVNTNLVQIENVQLYDVLGKQIQSWNIALKHKEGNKLRLKTNKLSSGIYFVKLKSSQGVTEKKVYLGF
ncbi:DUF4347 domain-containing protein [uncultured Kordia sp.]|uniref:DUF4347 domain-containing protein n=1 Tax=uncultured Kordia sp. TaxID=507699 RepID=UPI0026347EEA|nr:DUF4347 domain-containing protein [uncultured Kordia sp.]